MKPLKLRIRKLLRKESAGAQGQPGHPVAPSTAEVDAKPSCRTTDTSTHHRPIEQCHPSTAEALHEPAVSELRRATPAGSAVDPAPTLEASNSGAEHGAGVQDGDTAGHEASNASLAAAPRDLWLEAFERLPLKTQQELGLSNPAEESYHQQLHELTGLVKARQEECEQKFWKLRVGIHEIVLRDYAVTIVDVLRKIGDIAIQFAPPPASIPWAAVKAVLQAPIVESAQMCALLASVDKIVRIINRGQVYELVYSTENTPKLAFDNLQTALIELYTITLEMLANSTSLFSKNTAERTVYAIFHPGETADLFSRLLESEKELDREAQACESGRSAAADDAMTGLLRKLEAPLARVDDKVSRLLEHVDMDEQLSILEWISPIPYRKHHDLVREARTPGTCQWLLHCEEFLQWEAASSSVILWLQGSPGAGKTFLASRVIDHIESIFKASPNHEGFAFFYCNRNEADRRDPLSVLQSYVRQLSTVAASPGEMRGRLRALCRETRQRGAHLTLETCREQLLESVNLYPRTTLVLDALDECEPDTRTCLVDTLELLVQRSERPLKIFISSRPDGDIRDRLLLRPNIKIQATHNRDDIAKFVKEEIVKHVRWRKLAPSLREKIVRTLLDRSQGMFQWAFLQIKQLLELRTEAAIQDRLGKLPDTLEGAYDEIYGNIAARNEYEKALADRAFMWVMCGPLYTDQLLGAIRVDPESDTLLLSEELDEDLMLDLCKNLLVLDSQSRVWRFSHLSVREYFEKNHWSLLQAHCYVARACLLLLTNTNINEDELDDGASSSTSDYSVTRIPACGSLRTGWHVLPSRGQGTCRSQ